MAERTLNDLGQTLIAQIEEIVTGGDQTTPPSKNTFISWATPGIAFSPDDFTFCSKGIGGGANAEEDKLLVQQAFNFANLIDFIPDRSRIYNNDMQRTIWHTSEARLSHLYGEILRFSKVVASDLTPEQKAKIEKFRNLLRTTKKVKDIITEEEKEVTVDGPVLQAYNEKMANYTAAALVYNSKRVAAQGATGPEGKAVVADWVNNAALYRLQVKAAMDAWVSGGYRNEVDQMNAYINQVTQRDMMLWKQHLQEMYNEARLTGTSAGSDFFYTTLIPGNFASKESGWTNYSVNHSSTSTSQHSSSSSWGGSAGVSFGFWSAGASASHSSSSSDSNVKLSSFEMSFDLAQIVISRPWFYPEFFMNRGWTLRKGEGWMYDDLPSNGEIPPKGNFIGYPTTALFARNIRIKSADFVSAYHQQASSTSAGGSVGWGPFRLGGSYSHADSSQSFNSTTDGETLTVPGMQIIGFVNYLIGKAPNPLPDIKEEQFQ